MTRMKPVRTKVASDSEETIIITPTVMMVIIATSIQVGFSRRKIKAKVRTKAREEDLHIAVDGERERVNKELAAVRTSREGGGGAYTIESE